ncbi:MAG: helix-turn-helix transcriptional regulator [Candidatus Aminicenantes bacterium]|nr:helix-turn-helix transcriptional regulator [Candidatus Aminicenantes bacterium]
MFLLILPLIPVSLFMYLNFTAEILDIQLSNRLKKILIISWGFFLLLYLMMIGRVYFIPSESLVGLVLSLVYLLAGIVYYLSNFFLVFKASKIKDKTRQRTIQFIGFFYLGVLSFYIISFLQVIKLSHFSFLVLHFGYNIPPLIFLFFYLKKSNLGISIPIGQEENLKNFFKQHGITPRESEIILMLLSGRKNKDIGKELFISCYTVKNHLHNIYQKLDVRSRIHLYEMIMNHIQKG